MSRSRYALIAAAPGGEGPAQQRGAHQQGRRPALPGDQHRRQGGHLQQQDHPGLGHGEQGPGLGPDPDPAPGPHPGPRPQVRSPRSTVGRWAGVPLPRGGRGTSDVGRGTGFAPPGQGRQEHGRPPGGGRPGHVGPAEDHGQPEGGRRGPDGDLRRQAAGQQQGRPAQGGRRPAQAPGLADAGQGQHRYQVRRGAVEEVDLHQAPRPARLRRLHGLLGHRAAGEPGAGPAGARGAGEGPGEDEEEGQPGRGRHQGPVVVPPGCPGRPRARAPEPQARAPPRPPARPSPPG